MTLLFVCANTVVASIVFPLSPEEAAMQREEWIADTVNRSDLVASALVTAVEPAFQFGPTLGDWAVVLTGSRFGLPRHVPELVVDLTTHRLLKGQVGNRFAVQFNAADPITPKMSDTSYVPRRILEAHEYVFFCRRTAGTFEMIDFMEATEDPKLESDILAHLRRVDEQNKAARSNSSPPSFETEVHSVLSAVIRDLYIGDRARLLVIAHQSPCPTASQASESPDQDVEEMRQQMEDYAFQRMPRLSQDTIDDFHTRLKECHPLARQLDIPVPYVLVDQEDLAPLFPEGEHDREWRRFYAKYPGSSGIISFSNLGFNQDFTQAVVSTARGCGGLCGAGQFVLLTKYLGVWKVRTKIGTWVS